MSTTVAPPTSTKLPRVADYARLSSDDVKDPAQRGKSVTIQLKACARHRAKQPDWAFVQSFQDNDITASAYGKKEREDFDNLMALVGAGGVEIILCTEVTRLFRKPLEAEILIDLVWPVTKTTFHTIVTTRGGHYDVRTSAGRKALRDAVNAAAGESDNISDRVREIKADMASDGQPNGGRRPFGFEPNGITHREQEKTIWMEGYRRLLDGESPYHIFGDWNRRG